MHVYTDIYKSELQIVQHGKRLAHLCARLPHPSNANSLSISFFPKTPSTELEKIRCQRYYIMLNKHFYAFILLIGKLEIIPILSTIWAVVTFKTQWIWQKCINCLNINYIFKMWTMKCLHQNPLDCFENVEFWDPSQDQATS